jgi:hypothetical protein
MKTPDYFKQINLTCFVLRNILALLDGVVWLFPATSLPVLDKEKDRDREAKKASK